MSRLVFALLLACGGGQMGAEVGRSNGGGDERAVELALRTPTGPWVHVGDLRGRPVLIFLFATYDSPSQAALRPTARFARDYPDVHVLGIAAQPDADQLLDPYERALDPGFPLTYDPQDDVRHGTSSLGAIESIPMFLMLDAYGVEVGRHHGFPNTRTLENLRRDALERGGLAPDEDPPPLIGTSP